MKDLKLCLTFDFWLPWMIGYGGAWCFHWVDLGPFTFWWWARNEKSRSHTPTERKIPMKTQERNDRPTHDLEDKIFSLSHHQATLALHLIAQWYSLEKALEVASKYFKDEKKGKSP